MEAARRAQERDLAEVAALVRLAREELEPTRGGELWALRRARRDPVEDSLVADHRDGDALMVVGTLDDVVVGWATAHLEDLGDGTRLAVLTEVYVHPDARSVGVGEAMMDLVVAWAGQHDCRGIDSAVLPGNRAAKNFFETFGLVAREIAVHRDLRGDVGGAGDT